MKKTFILIVLASGALIAGARMAFAQGVITINPALPGISNISSTGPCGWVVDFYNFALLFAGILAFGAIVYGGFLYATSAGNAHKQGEGREWIWSALIGILLLAGAYLILYTINPNLTKCSLPALSNIAASGGGTTSGGGTSGGGTSNGGSTSGNGSVCAAPANGPCANAQNLSCFGNSAQIMQGICNRESGGNPAIPSGVDIGADGKPVSFGLFQINISATSLVNPATGQTVPCPSAFSSPYTAKNHSTIVTNTALYNQCVQLAEDPTTNISNACLMSNGGTNLTPWKSSTGACGI